MRLPDDFQLRKIPNHRAIACVIIHNVHRAHEPVMAVNYPSDCGVGFNTTLTFERSTHILVSDFRRLARMRCWSHLPLKQLILLTALNRELRAREAFIARYAVIVIRLETSIIIITGPAAGRQANDQRWRLQRLRDILNGIIPRGAGIETLFRLALTFEYLFI